MQFQIFESYGLGQSRPTYAELAWRHGITETAVTNHPAWTRRTLRMFGNRAMRGVTAGVRELREEMRRLWI